MKDLLKRPSAFVPIILSLVAWLFVIGYGAVFGIEPAQEATDEGTAAHIFQLLLGIQIPIIFYFALRWLPRKPKEALSLIGLQAFSIVIAFSLVFIFGM